MMVTSGQTVAFLVAVLIAAIALQSLSLMVKGFYSVWLCEHTVMHSVTLVDDLFT